MLINPSKWPRVASNRVKSPGVYFCVKKDGSDTFAINVTGITELNTDLCEYFGPVRFLPPRPIPPKPEFRPILIELKKDCEEGREGEAFWAVQDMMGAYYRFDGLAVTGKGIAQNLCKVIQ